MSLHVTTAVIVLKTITLLLSGLVTYFAFKAYRRTGAVALRALAFGFAFVTIGALFAGAADQLVGAPIQYALLIESAFTALGFAIITYSLYVK